MSGRIIRKVLIALQKLCSKYDISIKINKNFIWIERQEYKGIRSVNFRPSIDKSIEEKISLLDEGEVNKWQKLKDFVAEGKENIPKGVLSSRRDAFGEILDIMEELDKRESTKDRNIVEMKGDKNVQ